MFTRALGMHRANGLFNIRLEPGELLLLPSLRDARRFAPPNPEAGLHVWDLVLFFLCFPLSRTATAALHGWALRLPTAARPLALPACAALAFLQCASTALALLVIVAFALFGSMFNMCAYGVCCPPRPLHATPLCLRGLSAACCTPSRRVAAKTPWNDIIPCTAGFQYNILTARVAARLA